MLLSIVLQESFYISAFYFKEYSLVNGHFIPWFLPSDKNQGYHIITWTLFWQLNTLKLELSFGTLRDNNFCFDNFEVLLWNSLICWKDFWYLY